MTNRAPLSSVPAVDTSDLMLVFHPLAARKRARAVAQAEALALLKPLGAEVALGGPGGDRGAVFWLRLPETTLLDVAVQLERIGYCDAVWQVVEARDGADAMAVVWRHRRVLLEPLYLQDREAIRQQAPDRRVFMLETRSGVRVVRGYRGDGAALSRRALPVADCRMLVNIHGLAAGRCLLDPFAGAGGIVCEAVASAWRTVSADIDGALRHGLAAMGAEHHVADARRLPLANGSVDAVATEPPYDASADDLVRSCLPELERVLVPGGRISALVSTLQAPLVRTVAATRGWTTELDSPIDRKGLAVHLLMVRCPGGSEE